jgi:hypothetical protein
MSGAGGVTLHPKGFAQFTAVSGVLTLGTSAPATGTTPIPDGAIKALIQPEAQDVRWTDDGTTPTATIGMLLKVNTVLEYEGDLAKFKFIETAASAKVNVNYYGI